MRKEIFVKNALRLAAVTQLRYTPAPESIWTPEELLHESQVQHVELEMQCEELRRIHLALDLSRDKYVNLYDYSPVSYLTLSKNGLIEESNLTAARLFGVDRSNLLCHYFSDFIAPKSADVWYLFFSGLKKNIQRKNIELILKHNDGHEFPILLNYLQTTFADSELMLRISLTDISDKNLLTAEIDGALKYAENIIESLREPILVLSSDLTVISANLSFYKMFNVNPNDTIGKYIYNLGNRQWDIPKLRILLEDILPNATAFNDYEVKHDFPNIGPKVILLNAREIFREETGSKIILLAMADITNRRSLEEKKKNDDALKYSDNIIDTMREPLLVLSSNFMVMTANLSFYKTFGVTAEETIGKYIYNLGNGQWDIPRLRILLEDILPNATALNDYEVDHNFPNIGHKVFTLNAREIFREKIGTHIILLAMEDITKKKQQERESSIAAIAFETQEGMVVTDAEGTILRINNAFTKITGYIIEDLFGKNTRVLQSGLQPHQFYVDMWDIIADCGFWSGEVWSKRKNGECYPEHLTITAVFDEKGIVTNYIGTMSDITIRRAAAAEIEQLAFYDPLTGLPNIRLLRDRLKPALASSYRSGRKGALLFIDLDNFKTLNDSLGHDIGDLLLKQVAQRLEFCVREGDTVARLGGDEFVVILEDLSERTLEAATQAEVICNKILEALNQPYQLTTHYYNCTSSIGATLFNEHDQSADELLKQADIAMYQAKDAGRNAMRFFDQQMQININTRVAMEANLRLAIKENQFELYYQPQVNHNGQIIGAEVLIRWQHPQNGLILPAYFIPLAEATGLILPIGLWAIKTACTQIKNWESHIHTQHLVLAVNVSARQFHLPDFVEQVRQVILLSAINPERLKLELTEGLLLDDINDSILKMNALREIGVSFSMDDFGTGYSSLAYLTQLPIDQLKIDQSFVRNIGIKPTDAVIAQTIIGMGNSLGISVIAEGVETESQRAFLEKHGCTLYQGYLFSKPVQIEQFEALLREH